MRNPHKRCKPLPVSSAAIEVRAKRLRGFHIITAYTCIINCLFTSMNTCVHVIQCGYPHLRPFTEKITLSDGLIVIGTT